VTAPHDCVVPRVDRRLVVRGLSMWRSVCRVCPMHTVEARSPRPIARHLVVGGGGLSGSTSENVRPSGWSRSGAPVGDKGQPSSRWMSGDSNTSNVCSARLRRTVTMATSSWSWTLVGAGFWSCPVCVCEVSACSATRRRTAGRCAHSAKVGLGPPELGVCGVWLGEIS
jgi:hypothetical protein